MDTATADARPRLKLTAKCDLMTKYAKYHATSIFLHTPSSLSEMQLSGATKKETKWSENEK